MLFSLNTGYGTMKKTLKLNHFLAKVWTSREKMYITAMFTHVVLLLCKNKIYHIDLRLW